MRANKIVACPVEVGLKVEVDKTTLIQLKENPHIKDNFKLNILQLDEDRYSVYFDNLGTKE